MVVYGGQDPPEDLWALNFGSVVGIEPAPIGRASLMLQTRPNPAAAEVTVEFSVPREGAASLTVYDLRGRSVRDLIRGPVPAGTQRIRWDRTTDHGTRASAGVYFLSLRSESGTASRRFLLID